MPTQKTSGSVTAPKELNSPILEDMNVSDVVKEAEVTLAPIIDKVRDKVRDKVSFTETLIGEEGRSVQNIRDMSPDEQIRFIEGNMEEDKVEVEPFNPDQSQYLPTIPPELTLYRVEINGIQRPPDFHYTWCAYTDIARYQDTLIRGYSPAKLTDKEWEYVSPQDKDVFKVYEVTPELVNEYGALTEGCIVKRDAILMKIPYLQHLKNQSAFQLRTDFTKKLEDAAERTAEKITSSLSNPDGERFGEYSTKAYTHEEGETSISYSRKRKR